MEKGNERKKLARALFIATAFIAVSTAVMEYAGLDYLKSLVDKYDLVGFFILITSMNVVIQPVSPDFVIAGSPFFLSHSTFTIAMVSAIAGVASGVIAYALGGAIGLKKFERFFGEKNTEKGCSLYEKYGVWAIVISAVTPIPYSLICWMAGIFKMATPKFMIAIMLTRAPRHIVVAYYSAEIMSYLQSIGLMSG